MKNHPEVFETLGWNGTCPLRAERHLNRAARACATLGYPFDRAAAEAVVARLPAGWRGWAAPGLAAHPLFDLAT